MFVNKLTTAFKKYKNFQELIDGLLTQDLKVAQKKQEMLYILKMAVRQIINACISN